MGDLFSSRDSTEKATTLSMKCCSCYQVEEGGVFCKSSNLQRRVKELICQFRQIPSIFWSNLITEYEDTYDMLFGYLREVPA